MKNRRGLLKGLAVGSVWATPVVSSVVLPVHAATSQCSLPAGNYCLTYEFGPALGSSNIDWPGGTGPHTVSYDYNGLGNQDCTAASTTPYTSDFVIASSIEDATSALGEEPNYGLNIGIEGCLLYELNL